MAIPERLGKYRVTGVLGEGAMGIVYKGFDPGIGRVVALKTVRHHGGGSTGHGGSEMARFRNEAQAAGRLAHPGIVAVYDYGDEGDTAYIAMEFVEGRSLAQCLSREMRLGEDDILSLMTQLLEALDHAHAKGVWHRDIKPANLILTQEGRLKVADFGIARIESMALTQATSILGTPGYMAPEQFLGRGVDRRADLYASGVLLYQLLVGRPPFTGTPESLMYRVVHEPPVLPSVVAGHGHGARYDGVLARALAKDPAQRFDSALAFRQALVELSARPVQQNVSGDTIVMVMEHPDDATLIAPPSTTSNWDPAVLAEVEATLAKHLGPLASVLVRRAARECADLPSLYARLAEQVTHPAARSAILARGAGGTRPGTTAATRSTHATAPPAQSQTIVSDALLAQSTKLLAQHLGPIATVVVKRAAARTRERKAFFDALEESVSDATARLRLRTDLDRLV